MEKDKERQKKIEDAEQKLANQEGSKIMRSIIAKTYSRHALLSEEEFLKKIGFEGSGKSEEEAIRIATFNVLVEATMELFRAQNSLKFTKNTLDLFLNGQKSEEK